MQALKPKLWDLLNLRGASGGLCRRTAQGRMRASNATGRVPTEISFVLDFALRRASSAAHQRANIKGGLK